MCFFKQVAQEVDFALKAAALSLELGNEADEFFGRRWCKIAIGLAKAICIAEYFRL